MRNKRLILVLAGAVFFGLLATLSVTQFLVRARGNSETTRAVVAKVAIPLGSQIIAEHLTTLNFAKGTTPEGVFESPDKLVGRVSVVNISANEPVTETKLAPEGTAGGLSAVIPEGYRAMTVKVDDVVGLSGFVMPGTLVDIVVVIEPPSDKNASRDPISKIVLQNIKVLASGQNIDAPKNKREAESVKTVTVQVTPAQAEKLALASTEGKLRLMMRNAADQNDEQTPGATRQSLLAGEQALAVPEPRITAAAAPKAAPKARTVRVRAPRPAPAQVTNAPAPAPAPAPVPRTVDMFEGIKKRTIDFP